MTLEQVATFVLDTRLTYVLAHRDEAVREEGGWRFRCYGPTGMWDEFVSLEQAEEAVERYAERLRARVERVREAQAAAIADLEEFERWRGER